MQSQKHLITDVEVRLLCFLSKRTLALRLANAIASPLQAGTLAERRKVDNEWCESTASPSMLGLKPKSTSLDERAVINGNALFNGAASVHSNCESWVL